ncbi:MAG: hypothetical protein JXL97_03070 [Bacteroidales bacterium]|nr:hypothetical protein [Bacteroidales bacterium]
MQKIEVIKKLIISVELSLVNGFLNEAKETNDTARRLLLDLAEDKNSEILNDKLIRQQHEITVLMAKLVAKL